MGVLMITGNSILMCQNVISGMSFLLYRKLEWIRLVEEDTLNKGGCGYKLGGVDQAVGSP